MSMPGKNGAELLHDIRDICPQTLRFIAGDVTDQSLIINCIGGTHQFIRRPIQPATARGHLEARPETRQLAGHHR